MLIKPTRAHSKQQSKLRSWTLRVSNKDPDKNQEQYLDDGKHLEPDEAEFTGRQHTYVPQKQCPHQATKTDKKHRSN